MSDAYFSGSGGTTRQEAATETSHCRSRTKVSTPMADLPLNLANAAKRREAIKRALRPFTLNDVFTKTDDEKEEIKIDAVDQLVVAALGQRPKPIVSNDGRPTADLPLDLWDQLAAPKVPWPLVEAERKAACCAISQLITEVRRLRAVLVDAESRNRQLSDDLDTACAHIDDLTEPITGEAHDRAIDAALGWSTERLRKAWANG